MSAVLAAISLAPTRPPTPARAELPRGPGDLQERLEAHRRELTVHCRRMLGCSFEADDAVQETLVRAWRAIDRFEGRSSLRSWLYRIASNVCLDMIAGRKRWADPVDLASWPTAEAPDRAAVPDDDPAERAVARDSVRLALVTALLHLPPRQRAVLILCEVLRWKATEVADLFDTTVPSVNGALQRARATLAASPGTDDLPCLLTLEQRTLLTHCTDAFERYDVDALVELLR